MSVWSMVRKGRTIIYTVVVVAEFCVGASAIRRYAFVFYAVDISSILFGYIGFCLRWLLIV